MTLGRSCNRSERASASGVCTWRVDREARPKVSLGEAAGVRSTAEGVLAIAVSQESEVVDLHKAAGQHMQEEPPNKLDGLQGLFLELVLILGIASGKTHTAIVQTY
jgi:hypothetical protein